MAAILRPYEPREAPTWAHFRQEFQDTIEELTQDNVELPPLTGKQLHDFVKHWSSAKAGGLDGWQVRDLQILPRAFFTRLAEIYTIIEKTGEWPEALVQGRKALIPKPGDGGGPVSYRALDQRPLTVLTLGHWLLAGVRLE